MKSIKLLLLQHVAAVVYPWCSRLVAMKLYKALCLFSLLYLCAIGTAVSQEVDFFGIPLSPGQKTPGQSRSPDEKTTPHKQSPGEKNLASDKSDFRKIPPSEAWQLSDVKEKKGPLQYYWVDGNQGSGRLHLIFRELSQQRGKLNGCFLVLHVSKRRNSHSRGWIRVRIAKTGEVIGSKKGVPKGEEIRIPLKISSGHRLNPLVLEVTTGSNDGMRFLGEGSSAPYLEVR